METYHLNRFIINELFGSYFESDKKTIENIQKTVFILFLLTNSQFYNFTVIFIIHRKAYAIFHQKFA